MAKFHIRLKIQGFELDVEGTREGARDDIPVLRQALTEQIAGLISPATDIAGGEVTTPSLGGSTLAAATAAAGQAKRNKRRPRSGGAPSEQKELALDWRHNTTKYGSPLQGWTGADKAIYLLYVAAQETTTREMSSGQIAATFAKQFRQAGLIQRGNLSRDLGRLKKAQNGQKPLVSEDTTKTPPAWFLTEAGIAHAQRLIAQALGGSPATV